MITGNNGWITLHRKLLEWEWYDDIIVCRLFIHCLLRANRSDKTWRGISIKKGEFLTSRDKLAEQTGLGVQQVRSALNKLKSTSELTIKTTSKYTVISVTNWSQYQERNQQTNQQVTNNQPASNQQVTTNNNHNNQDNQNNKDKTKTKGDNPEPTKNKPKRNAIPYQQIVDLYHELLPELPRCEVITTKRKGQIAARHRDLGGELRKWGNFFKHIRMSEFLMGKTQPLPGRKQFKATLEWVTNESNFANISEDQYHG